MQQNPLTSGNTPGGGSGGDQAIYLVQVDGLIENEQVTSGIDGVNTSFLSQFVYRSGSLKLYINGLLQKKNLDFSEQTGNVFTVSVAPQVGDIILITYIKS